MGYGGSRVDAGKAIGKTGDEGIDGIIKEDRLGLGVIRGFGWPARDKRRFHHDFVLYKGCAQLRVGARDQGGFTRRVRVSKPDDRPRRWGDD